MPPGPQMCGLGLISRLAEPVAAGCRLMPWLSFADQRTAFRPKRPWGRQMSMTTMTA